MYFEGQAAWVVVEAAAQFGFEVFGGALVEHRQVATSLPARNFIPAFAGEIVEKGEGWGRWGEVDVALGFIGAVISEILLKFLPRCFIFEHLIILAFFINAILPTPSLFLISLQISTI